MEYIEVNLVDPGNNVVHTVRIRREDVLDVGVLKYKGKHYVYRNSSTIGFDDIRFTEVNYLEILG